MGKKIILIIVVVLLIGGGIFLGYKLGTKKPAEPTPQKEPTPQPVAITSEEKETMKKISELAFNLEKENLKIEEMPETQKSEIARELIGMNLTDVTGTEMTQGFQKYFGKNQKVIYDDIPCGFDHGSAEENIMLIFDESQDKYIYNEKHPGHGGGGTRYGFEMVEENAEATTEKYTYDVKILFYGPAQMYDVGGQSYGKGYKSYQDSKTGTNALLNIDESSEYWETNDGPPTLNKEKLMADYKSQLDTYSFTFIKEDGHLIFKSYQKK